MAGRTALCEDETKTIRTGVNKARRKAAATKHHISKTATKHKQRDGHRRIKSAGAPLGTQVKDGPFPKNNKRRINSLSCPSDSFLLQYFFLL